MSTCLLNWCVELSIGFIIHITLEDCIIITISSPHPLLPLHLKLKLSTLLSQFALFFHLLPHSGDAAVEYKHVPWFCSASASQWWIAFRFETRGSKPDGRHQQENIEQCSTKRLSCRRTLPTCTRSTLSPGTGTTLSTCGSQHSWWLSTLPACCSTAARGSSE